MTPYEDALKWIRDTKICAQSWTFGSNPREVRSSLSKNRDAIGIADSYSYQIDLALHQVKSNTERMEIKEEYDELKDILDKRRECLDVISQITKMEDLFSTLTSDVEATALDLSSKSQQTVTSFKQPLNIYSSQAIAENCMKSLQQSWSYLQSLAQCNQVHLQNASHYHQFWHEVEESNEWLQYQLAKLPQLQKRSVKGTSYEIKRTMEEMMRILKDYLQWQTRLDILFERAKHIVPLKARTEKIVNPKQAQVLVDYSAAEYDLHGGDVVTLIDNSDTKRWKVKVEGNSEEIIVPAIIIFIPPTDSAALDAALRLRLQMLAMWSSTTKILGKHVTRILLEVFKSWNDDKNSDHCAMNDTQRKDLIRTLGYMDETLGLSSGNSSVYKELVKRTKDIVNCTEHSECSVEDGTHRVTIVVQVNYLQRFLQRYWDFWTYCDAYRIVLEQLRQPMNIFLYDNSTRMRYITTAHFVKFWDCDLEDQSQHAVEEEMVAADQADGLQNANCNSEEEYEEEFFESGTSELKAQTEEVIESEMEVETTFVITGIVSNPGKDPERIISLQDAIDQGIIDPNRGLYINKSTYAAVAIPQAMNDGLIKMGPKEEKKSEEKVKSAGIITVRTTRETRPYEVQRAMDSRTGEMVSAEQAYTRGILDPDHGTYKDLRKGTVMLIGDAVQHKLVDIEYEPNNYSMVLEEVSKAYLIHAVVCQRTKSNVPFHEAVQSGIIEKDTGTYINTVTGEKMFIVDAINKGFVKATESDEPPSLSAVDIGQAAINYNIGTIRKKVLNPLRALKAMKPSQHKLFNGDTVTNNNTSSN